MSAGDPAPDHGFRPVRDGGFAVVWIEPKPGDGAQPTRRLYWLHAEAVRGGWTARVPEGSLDAWLDLAVAADFEEAGDLDKRSWRLATRFVPARFRSDPPRLGVDAELLGTLRWERP